MFQKLYSCIHQRRTSLFLQNFSNDVADMISNTDVNELLGELEAPAAKTSATPTDTTEAAAPTEDQATPADEIIATAAAAAPEPAEPITVGTDKTEVTKLKTTFGDETDDDDDKPLSSLVLGTVKVKGGGGGSDSGAASQDDVTQDDDATQETGTQDVDDEAKDDSDYIPGSPQEDMFSDGESTQSTPRS